MKNLPPLKMTHVASVIKGEKPLYWDCSLQDRHYAERIASRACEEAKARAGAMLDWYLVYMDILTCHCNCCALNLLQLLMSDPNDFQHDVAGIGVNINRKTGQLQNGFVPIFRQKNND